jgi:DNA mismatch repair protein MutS
MDKEQCFLEDEKKQKTPLMIQYHSIKKNYKDFILFFRLGDFYEMFFDDATIASKILNIFLTKRSKEVPMCGIPAHNYNNYLKKLVWAGKKVAICEQTETPSEAKENGRLIVNREVTRIITKSNIEYEIDEISTGCNIGLLSLYIENKNFYTCLFDINTGMFIYYNDVTENLSSFLIKISPAEIITNVDIINDDIPLKWKEVSSQLKISNENNNIKNIKQISEKILNFYNTCGDGYKKSFDMIFNYLNYISSPLPQEAPIIFSTKERIFLNETLIKKLNILDHPMGKEHTLLGIINYTLTTGGERLLRKEICLPLSNIQKINERLDIIQNIIVSFLRQRITVNFPTIDPQRLFHKITNNNCSINDIYNFSNTVIEIEELFAFIKKKSTCVMFKNIKCDNQFSQYLKSLFVVEETSNTISFIKNNNENLQSLEKEKEGFLLELNVLHNKYIQITGINNLKIKSNEMSGMFIEIPLSQMKKIGESFTFKQSLTNCSRYLTNELIVLDKNIMIVENNIQVEKKAILQNICLIIIEQKEYYKKLIESLFLTDFFFSLAKASFFLNMSRPVLNDTFNLKIINGRHIVVEKHVSEFIPNNTNITLQKRIMLITGPNMGGKSTYLRQNAIIVCLGHIGCFVPAETAEIGVVDNIFIRIGADDDISSQKSTFMMEMEELSKILEKATPRSLLILDEIGRGTSVKDGLSIAEALLEYIVEDLMCRTFFATHFYELSKTQSDFIGFLKTSYFFDSNTNNIVLLHKIEYGVASSSFGINVAKMVKLPEKLIKRSEELFSLKNKIENF